METLVKSYWVTLEDEELTETETSEEEVENEDQAPAGADPVETSDPDFKEVSEMLRESTTPSPSPSPSSSPQENNETTESVDYVPYLNNISIQLGVIDIVLVLALLIFVIKQFVRVPR